MQKNDNNMSTNLSIIIPHRNIPILLKRCIQSIPQRNDIQIIIVDDNSDPKVVDFSKLKSLKTTQTELYITKEGKGAGYARNIGLSHAKGKWITFADADDFFTEDFERIFDLYLNTQYDVILFPINIVNSETLQKTEQRDCWINTTIESTLLTKEEKLSLVVSPHSKIIKHDLITKNKIEFEEIPFSNDVMFSTKLALLAKDIHIDSHNCIYTLTVRHGSLTTIKNKNSLRCRLETDIRRYKYLKSKHHANYMSQINNHYLYWASEISLVEVLYTGWKLFLNGLLFYNSPLSWKNKYYNSGWYYLYKAILKSFNNNIYT